MISKLLAWLIPGTSKTYRHKQLWLAETPLAQYVDRNLMRH